MTATSGQRPEAPFFTTVRGWGITRGRNRVLGGVVEGVGERIGMDRVPARIIAVVLAVITSGLFLTAYAVAWAILPDRDGRIIIQDFGRGEPNVPALIGIGIVGLIGLNGLAWTGPRVGWVGASVATFFGLLLVVGIVALIAWAVASSHPSGPSAPGFDGSDREAWKAARDEAKAKMHEAKASMKDAARAYRDGARATGSKVANDTKQAADRVAEAAQSTGAAIAAEGRATARRAKAAAAEIRDAVAARPVVDPEPGSPTPPLPPRPYLRPRVPGPGRTIRLIAFAAAVLAAAAVWGLDYQGALSVPPLKAWFAVAIFIVGFAIIAAGAAGRRVGVFGFYATALVIGWSAYIIGGPKVEHFFDSHDILIGTDGARVAAVDPGTVECRDFSHSLASEASANTLDARDWNNRVTVLDHATTITVPREATVTLVRPSGDVTGSVSWMRERLDGDPIEFATCTVDGPSATFYTPGKEERAHVSVTVAQDDINIVIVEEN